MVDGGKLTIETANCDSDHYDGHNGADAGAGEFIRIQVSDTGSGMSPEVQAKAFEPFFTTKEIGKGSGLGLSMAFGFVNQSGGHIHLQSEPGIGTSVQLCLPRTTLLPTEQVVVDATATTAVNGGARILVVEDDKGIRNLLRHFLAGFGYSAVLFEDGPSAIAALERDATKYDLLITDMLLPDGVNGRQVAAKFLSTHADGRILYISGYAPDAEIIDGRLDDGNDFLAKPFTRDVLKRRIAEILKR